MLDVYDILLCSFGLLLTTVARSRTSNLFLSCEVVEAQCDFC